jgi:tetratricopeptide (TPR) repeat protein
MTKRLLAAAGLVAAALLLAGPAADAQSTGAVRGKVVDEKGQPLQDAVVVLDFMGGVTRKYEVKTNKKGEFTQVGLSPGNYKVTATKDGYQGGFIDTRVGLGEPQQLPEFKLLSKSAAQAAAAATDPNAALREAFTKASELSKAGKTDEAIAAYQEVLAKNPTIAEAHYNIGFLNAQKKDWATAEAAYLKAIEVKPAYGDAYTGLARVYQDSNQSQKAVEILAKAAAANPQDAKLQFNLGVFYLNSQRNEEAATAFTKAAELDPANAEPHYFLGTLAVGQNKIADAIAHLEKYLASNPTNPTNVATAQGLLQALKPKK